MKIGFVVNPLAGIGGPVALKGSDGLDIVEQAMSRGAKRHAGERALQAIECLSGRALEPDANRFITAPGQMGEKVLIEAGLAYETVSVNVPESGTYTTANDTRACICAFVRRGVDLIMFAGGDGTARDVLDALDSCNASTMPVIGIPAGVKIHSAVYGVTPVHAGELLNLILSGEPLSLHDAEVMDLDEDAFRQGRVIAKCYGYMRVPVDDTRMQMTKQGGINHEAIALQEIADGIIENMQDDVYYIMGSGSTVASIMDQLGLENTLLGIDIIRNGEVVVNDADEATILETIDDHDARIIVTIIGGQGHVFGRGNQQLSADVIRRVGIDNIQIIATNEKLRSLQTRPMITDTGDTALDRQLSGLHEVVTGYKQTTLYRLNDFSQK